MSADPKIIVALDYATDQEVFDFLPKLDPKLCRIKIGSVLFTHYGPALLAKIQQHGFSVFLDLKFHDIPQTVAGACRAAADLGVWMVTVHAAGGLAMLLAACQSINRFPIKNRPLLIGVTVLTSLNDQDLSEIGYQEDAAGMVLRFAKLAHQAALDGVVCSAQEAEMLRRHLPRDFLLIVPGIRLPDDAVNDQKRTMTPPAAIAAGADYLVIGRPITQAQHPQQTLIHMATSIKSIF